MFENRLEASLGNPRALLNLAADTMLAERTAGCRKLLIAAAWADCHSAPADLELVDGEPRQDLCEERFVRLGGAATPLVAEFSPSELGHTLQTSLGSARRLVACALTIRHRLPRLWDRVKAGDVWAWKAMQYADKTRHLGGLSSWLVDLKITRHVETMAWPRFLDLLDATLLEVDEATYQQRAEEAATLKDVRTYRGEHGLRTLIAKIEAGDALAFQALVDRVAECLADEGDDDPIGARRAKAVGIIAHQARLRDLLARHADQPHDPRHPEDRVNTHLDNPTDPVGRRRPTPGRLGNQPTRQLPPTQLRRPRRLTRLPDPQRRASPRRPGRSANQRRRPRLARTTARQHRSRRRQCPRWRLPGACRPR